jgi:hypothetical protein
VDRPAVGVRQTEGGSVSTYRTPIGTLRTETISDYDEYNGIELFIVTRFFIDDKEATSEEVQEFWDRVRGHAMMRDCPPLSNINYT